MFQESVSWYPMTSAEVPVSTSFVIPKFLKMLLMAAAILFISVVLVGVLLYGVMGFFSMMHASYYAPMITGVGMP